ncbi:VTT domain-containing protein [Secundilactobacillus folii]|uniref:Cytochrome O ubiquinol oxidase n=1 Tax=Secundilactobacillus folii TaxID=2678357 RepID=A0A7X3C3U5_9LACO|nr:VTT domain-containing protein [Secundilactobacillus folii]MTV83217.1 cytochrome O ubiquinol oxidase [Secundilactobacillus folii]
MAQLIDFVLHIDSHMVNIVNTFGGWSYGILFLIVFVETGAVILPFLPGDSLLFAAAALAANANYHLSIWLFMGVFLLAAVGGDSLNFLIGKRVGIALTRHPFFGRFIKEKNLRSARDFFEKHGMIAIFLARFMPIIRTFAPFVAATSDYEYSSFIRYNFAAAVCWVLLCCGGGFFFGNITFVKAHFSLVVIGIIVVSLIPAFIGLLKSRGQATED